MDHLGNKNPVNGTVGVGKSDGSVRAWGEECGRRRSKQEGELSRECAGGGDGSAGRASNDERSVPTFPIPPF